MRTPRTADRRDPAPPPRHAPAAPPAPPPRRAPAPPPGCAPAAPLGRASLLGRAPAPPLGRVSLLRRAFAAPRAAAPLVVFALGAGACLPGDQRPAPGVATVWLAAAEGVEARAPFVDRDGWAVTFDRVLVSSYGVQESYGSSFGGPWVEGGEGCERYYDTSMAALYDVVVPGERLVGRFAGLGTCGFGVRWGWGGEFDVLGPGVTDEDARRVLVDPRSNLHEGWPILYVIGAAQKGASTKSFALPFSSFSFLGGCEGEGAPFKADLVEGVAIDKWVTVHPEWLFFDHRDRSVAKLRFGPLADADDGGEGDGDGVITPAELAKRDLSELRDADGAYTLPPSGVPYFPPGGDDEGGPSLLDFLHWQARYVFEEEGDNNRLCASANR
ncbi:MAG TPA: hypothetical protein VFS43_08960 [Polyangiaceae bacterium]|nr:hypothetical protein [Polyangiaceae bacterium]